ncbi:polyprenyl synthetase family protein [Actinopolymorpha alba]|uniref:polyprenyl synthetase family protein n=1 Tax=Actinopolymorpha alba TaxID=533267 RepID=UPI000360C2F1|nr:polyprenyl synthetase family protein [Actinopolymorpha alba]
MRHTDSGAATGLDLPGLAGVPALADLAGLGGLRARVDQALEEFLRERAAELQSIDAELDTQREIITDSVAGGKRLRPAFCYWGWRGAGGDPDDPRIVVAAAALELLQAAAIVHDDLMDASDTRRGKPSVHRRFQALHDQRRWEGPAERFGLGGALLLGDLCLCWADEMLRGCGLPAERLLPAFGYFDLMRTEVMAGQYLDLVSQASGTTPQDRAMRVVRFKSAKYTVERPLHLGGALAGGSSELISAYSAYGLPLGEAFQLRDDILGVFGDPTVTGKPAGDDLREGKRTVLVAKTLAAATPAQAERFRQRFGDRALTSRGVAELRDIIVASGALAAVERLIVDLTEQAAAALAQAPLADEGVRDAFGELAQAATQRTG